MRRRWGLQTYAALVTQACGDLASTIEHFQPYAVHLYCCRVWGRWIHILRVVVLSGSSTIQQMLQLEECHALLQPLPWQKDSL